MTFYGLVYHIGFGRRTEHLFYGKVERTYTVSLLESETMITGCFTDYVHWSAFAFGNLTYMFNSLFFNQQTHTFLTFVSDDFFGRQSLVTDRQLAHIDQTTTFFHEFGQTVYVSGRSVVMDRNHRIHLFFTKSAYYVIGTFLHFCVGTLHGIQLDATAVTTGINRRYGTATQSDTVVVTTDNHYFVSSFRCAFQAVALCTVTNTTGKHDYFVVTINFFVFCMFESQYRTADQRLAELVTEVGSTIGCFD